jgi:tripartite-type tricarboxylate transporter receptor subunit TctC
VLVKALMHSDVKAQFANRGMDTVASTPQEFTAYLRDEYAKSAKLITGS